MPGGDGTGPFGSGPRLGRSDGSMAGFGMSRRISQGGEPGYGRGWCCRPSGGFRRQAAFWGSPEGPAPYHYQRPDAEDDREYLANEVRLLKEQITVLERRMGKLSTEERE